jgi:hypothetical protein
MHKSNRKVYKFYNFHTKMSKVGSAVAWVLGTLFAGAVIYFGGESIYIIQAPLKENIATYRNSRTPFFRKKLVEILCPEVTKKAISYSHNKYRTRKRSLEEERIKREFEEGEITYEEAKDMIKDLYGPIAGRDLTEKILGIAEDTSLTPEEAAERLVDEVPTGLPKTLDKWTKKTAKKIFRKFYEKSREY